MSKNYDELIRTAIEMLDNDDDLFCDCVDCLDRETGFADGYACFEMGELNDFYFGCKASDIIEQLTENFNICDDWFYFSLNGLESTDDKADLYRSNTSSGEVLDNLLRERVCVYNSEFDTLLEEIIEAQLS